MVWLNPQQNSFTVMTCCWPGLYHRPCVGGRSVIRLLNPTMQLVTIYAHETLECFFPLSPTDEVCTVYSSDEGPICHNVASSEKEVGHRNHALQQLEQGAEGLSKEEKMALRSLLNSYVDVFALVDGEFSKSNKINTQGAEPVKHAAQKAMAIPQKRRGAGYIE